MFEPLISALTCIPLLVVLAFGAVAWLAYRTRNRHWRDLAIVLAFLIATSWFWANPTTMLSYSGPFHGKVVDADSGKAIANAAVELHWYGAFAFYHTYAWATSDENGDFHIPWQGLLNWRVGSWPGMRFMTISSPGHANAKFYQDGGAVDQGASLVATTERASFDDWTIRLPPLKPGVKVLSPLWNDWLTSMTKGMPSAAARVYNSAYGLACHTPNARGVTDLELQQVRTWALISGAYQNLPNERPTDNLVGALSGSKPDWDGQVLVIPHLVSTENTAKACQELRRAAM